MGRNANGTILPDSSRAVAGWKATTRRDASTQHRRPPLICLHGWLLSGQLASLLGGLATPLAVEAPESAGYRSSGPDPGPAAKPGQYAAGGPSTGLTGGNRTDRAGGAIHRAAWRCIASPPVTTCLG